MIGIKIMPARKKMDRVSIIMVGFKKGKVQFTESSCDFNLLSLIDKEAWDFQAQSILQTQFSQKSQEHFTSKHQDINPSLEEP